MKQTLKIGITLVVVAALAMSGIALAAQTATTDEAPAVEDTKAYAMIQEKLAPLVEAGTITQAQADEVAATLAEGMRGPRGHKGFHALKQVAEFLGLDREAMQEALSEYDTLADIAEANGSSADELIAYLVAQVEEHLADAVENGRLTQDEADEKLAEAEERITELVNSDIPEPGDRPGRRGPGGGGEGGDV